MIAQPVTKDLEEVARAAGQGTLRLPIARTVPLTEAIAALTAAAAGDQRPAELPGNRACKQTAPARPS